ncbi:MAG: hypothetical protein ABI606_22560, partial [Rhodoferax sp.]
QDLQPAGGRMRGASVPRHLRARGLGVCGALPDWHQHSAGRAKPMATANWHLRPGTAARSIGGGDWLEGKDSQQPHAHSMRLATRKRKGLEGAGMVSKKQIKGIFK